MILIGKFCFCRLQDMPITKADLQRTEDKIMAKVSSLAGTLGAVVTTLEKVLQEVETLKGQLGDAEIPADAQATLDRLTALATQLDELNPDSTTPPNP